MFQTTGKALYKVLGILAALIASKPKPTDPAWRHSVSVLVEVDRLSVTATNLDVIATVSVEGRGRFRPTGAGTALPFKALRDALKPLKGEVSLSLDGFDVTLETPGTSSKLEGSDPETFPLFRGEVEAGTLTLSNEDFRQAARHTWFSASTEKQRYALNGVFVEVRSGRVYFVSTDGKRLSSWATVASLGEGEAERLKPTIIPTQALQIAEKFARLGNGPVRILLPGENGVVRIGGENFSVLARRVAGAFPAYEEVIPKTSNSSIRFSRAELLGAIQIVKPVCKDKYGPICRIDFAPGQATLSSGVNGTTRKASVGCTVNGDPGAFGINPLFLEQALDVFRGDEVSFGFCGARTPIVLTDEAPDYRHVIMPVDLG